MMISPKDIKLLRNKHNLNQSDFWARIGVAQSGGSRYERGEKLSTQVQLLIQLAYGAEAEANELLAKLRDS